jgi:hypothetical protein
MAQYLKKRPKLPHHSDIDSCRQMVKGPDGKPKKCGRQIKKGERICNYCKLANETGRSKTE